MMDTARFEYHQRPLKKHHREQPHLREKKSDREELFAAWMQRLRMVIECNIGSSVLDDKVLLCLNFEKAKT